MSELGEFISSVLLHVYRKTLNKYDDLNMMDEELPRWTHLIDVYLRNTGLSAEIDFETLRIIMEECPEIASRIYDSRLIEENDVKED